MEKPEEEWTGPTSGEFSWVEFRDEEQDSRPGESESKSYSSKPGVG